MQTRGISAASAADVIKGTFVLKTAARSGDPAIRPKGMKFILAQNGAGIIAEPREGSSQGREREFIPHFSSSMQFSLIWVSLQHPIKARKHMLEPARAQIHANLCKHMQIGARFFLSEGAGRFVGMM